MRQYSSRTFAEQLRRYRLAANLTQEELAARAGLSARAISKLERGERQRPYPHTIEVLARALGLGADDRRALVAAALEGAAPSVRVGPPAESSPGSGRLLLYRPSPRHNLPAQLTSFIGRERELAQVTRQLTDGPNPARLVTLTGTGGCGKTRLALEVAARHVDAYADGVWLVELAPLSDPALVAPALVGVLGIQAAADRPLLGYLVEVLRTRRMLLVLDNCEHMLGACVDLADAILRGCPDVQIMATSREALGIPGEISWRVPSLAVPPPGESLPISDLLQVEAVRLFVDRAGAALPGLALTTQDARAVAQVCRRLDGIPLALELAASRLRGMSPRQLAGRLDQRFRLLIGGSRATLPRQQTLAATVAWSFDLLQPAEQTVFNRLAGFSDGFTVAAAEDVCCDVPIHREDVFGLLLRLVEKSLVVAEPNPEGWDRYRLLETLRLYAREKLDGLGEVETIAARHARYYLELAEHAEMELHGPEQAVWFDRLEREHNNLRVAIEWLCSLDQWVDALRLAGAIAWFWAVRGHYSEGRTRLSSILLRAGDQVPAILRVKVCEGLTYLSWRQGDLSVAEKHAGAGLTAASEAGDTIWTARMLVAAMTVDDQKNLLDDIDQALSLARAQGTAWVAGRALAFLAGSRFLMLDFAGAEAAMAEGLRLSRLAGDDWTCRFLIDREYYVSRWRGDYLRALLAAKEYGRIAGRLGDRSAQAKAATLEGDVALAQGDLSTALYRLSEGQVMFRDVADRTGVAWAGALLGEARLLQGDAEFAQEVARESLAVAQETGYSWVVVDAQQTSAQVALAQGDIAAARFHLCHGIRLCRHGLHEHVPRLLETLVRVALASDDPARALRLAASVAATRAKLGMKARPIDEAPLALAIRQAEQVLSDVERAAVWADGERMSREVAIEYALQQADQ
jgi:non-specific serine/threonine protein kinase